MQEEKVIIRFSQAWWVYMFCQGGILRTMVNGLEDNLSITGRTLLLIFLLYCGVKSGAMFANPKWTPPIWLEMGMFVLQLAGLEGSVPGLARHALVLQGKGDEKSAQKVQGAMTSARVMSILTIGEGVLYVFGIDSSILKIISGILLFIRGIVITSFLVELAKIEAKAPRVLSRGEHERGEHAKLVESEQAQAIADLRSQLEKAQLQETEQSQVVANMFVQIKQFEELQRENLQSAELQNAEIQRLQTGLQVAEQRLQNLGSADSELQTAKLQIQRLQLAERETAERSARLQGDLQTCRLQTSNLQTDLQAANSLTASLTAELQAANQQLADLQTPDEAPEEQADARITSIEQARARHEGEQGKKKVSYEEIMAFAEAHQGLAKAEIAKQLNVSERTVYNAANWYRDKLQSENAVATAN